MRSRVLFERLVKQFPTSARYWRAYIEHEVFGRCLWSCGINLIVMGVAFLYLTALLLMCVFVDVVSTMVIIFQMVKTCHHVKP